MTAYDSLIANDADEARDPALERDALRAGWGPESRPMSREDVPSRQEAEDER